ncbi:Protein CBG23245 [Caenorhabditis briggsae]|uniref:Protein CBG23245 n=1 Tax=Caenorhabditis briggsae TaxID=6238 RepID=A8Y4D4_CAEBR|nr:Protein CBG23245 [Caenorhabditis briggsae]CAP39754.1 Protein CBG23245 [Caenorhabditis briggsae]
MVGRKNLQTTVVGGGNGGAIGGTVGSLLGGNQDVLQNLLGVLGENPVTQLVSKLLAAISSILSNLPSVFDQLSAIINNKDHTLPQQTQAIDALKQQFPVEIDTVFYIASQVAKTLRGGNGGVVPELLEVPSVPETPRNPV